ncbi:uncharacterized protein V6R79_013899 [Siganus canaliculatus]
MRQSLTRGDRGDGVQSETLRPETNGSDRLSSDEVVSVCEVCSPPPWALVGGTLVGKSAPPPASSSSGGAGMGRCYGRSQRAEPECTTCPDPLHARLAAANPGSAGP